MGSTIKTLLCCSHQNITLRGHREGNNSSNPGNFRALLDFRVDSGDDVLAQHFSSAPKNAQYTSHRIQDQIIGLIGKQIQATILNAIQSGGRLFSIIADECRDCSNKEQMALVVRYVDAQSVVQEMFLHFWNVILNKGRTDSRVDSKRMFLMKLDMSLCRRHGAGNMAEVCNGAAKLIR